MLTIFRTSRNDGHGERGQTLVLSVFFLLLVVTVAALVLDAGFFLRARRDSQNTADAAALAGAQALPDDPIMAEDMALLWASQNGWTNGVDGVTVTITTPYSGSDRKIQVVVAGGAAGVGFFDALMNVHSRAVAEVIITDNGPGGSGGGPGDTTPMAQAPTEACDGSDNAVVDGRVTSGEGYDKFADLTGEFGTVFGEAFLACDSNYYYFALRLNALSDAVANENVYQCNAGKAGDVQINGSTIKKLKGSITSVAASSFTMAAAGETWTVFVDGSTTFEVDKQKPKTINDLAPGMEVDVKGSVVGPNEAFATQVKAKTTFGGCTGSFSPTYHADFNTGWVDSPKGTHTFKDLWKSDRARFQIACGSTPVHDFVQDYLHIDGSGWASDASVDGSVIVAGPADSSSSMVFNLENPTITHWGDDPGEDPLIQSPPFSPTYPDYSGEYGGWVWEMLYEFKVPISAYDGCASGVFFGLPPVSGGSGPVGGMHSSPAKTDEGVFVGVSTRQIILAE